MSNTDLHIQYKFETGEDFQFDSIHAKREGTGYHASNGYNREYSKWIEEKYLILEKDYKELLNIIKNL